MTVITTPETSASKRYTLKSWISLWQGSSDREAISIEALATDMVLAGFSTRTVFDEDNEAYLLMVDTAEGTFEISPAYMVDIDHKETLIAYVNEMNIYRQDGSALSGSAKTPTESIILDTINNCI